MKGEQTILGSDVELCAQSSHLSTQQIKIATVHMSEEHRVPPLAASCHELLSSRASWRKGALSRYAQSVRRSNHSVNIDQNTTRLGSGTQDNGLVFQEHYRKPWIFRIKILGPSLEAFPSTNPLITTIQMSSKYDRFAGSRRPVRRRSMYLSEVVEWLDRHPLSGSIHTVKNRSRLVHTV